MYYQVNRGQGWGWTCYGWCVAVDGMVYILCVCAWTREREEPPTSHGHAPGYRQFWNIKETMNEAKQQIMS